MQNDRLYEVDAKTGLQKLKYPVTAEMPGLTEFYPSPVTNANIFYLPAFDGFVYAFNAADGTVIWKTKSNGCKPFISRVTLNNNLLYAGCQDSSIYAFNINTGTIV